MMKTLFGIIQRFYIALVAAIFIPAAIAWIFFGLSEIAPLALLIIPSAILLRNVVRWIFTGSFRLQT